MLRPPGCCRRLPHPFRPLLHSYSIITLICIAAPLFHSAGSRHSSTGTWVAFLCNTTRITPGVPTSPITRTAPSHRLTNYRLLSVFKINITKVGRYLRNILPLHPLSLLLRVPCPMQRHGICLKHDNDTPAYHFRLELSALATLAQQQEKGEGVRRQKGKVVEEVLCNVRCRAFGINRRHAHIVSKHTQHS